MTITDLEQQMRLIEASQKIANIYLQYGQRQKAQIELNILGHTLQNYAKEERGKN